MKFLILLVRVLITIVKVWLLPEGDLSLPCRPAYYCATEQTFEFDICNGPSFDLESVVAGLNAV